MRVHKVAPRRIHGNTLLLTSHFTTKVALSEIFNNVGYFPQIKPDLRHNNYAQIGFRKFWALAGDEKHNLLSLFIYMSAGFPCNKAPERFML